MSIISPTGIDGVLLLEPKKHADPRGFFSEVFRSDTLRQTGVDVHFVQDNHSKSGPVGVLRGLHFQIAPSEQGKLVRVTRGSILDVAVDIRRGSPTFGKHVSVELSADNWRQLWVPVGMAHGFVTLEPDTEVIYKVTSYYDPASDRGLAFDDPDLKIDWRFAASDLTLSPKDLAHPRLRDLPPHFSFTSGA